jgi:hypothetical protein
MDGWLGLDVERPARERDQRPGQFGLSRRRKDWGNGHPAGAHSGIERGSRGRMADEWRGG